MDVKTGCRATQDGIAMTVSVELVGNLLGPAEDDHYG
jgi:hypothetical protein